MGRSKPWPPFRGPPPDWPTEDFRPRYRRWRLGWWCRCRNRRRRRCPAPEIGSPRRSFGSAAFDLGSRVFGWRLARPLAGSRPPARSAEPARWGVVAKVLGRPAALGMNVFSPTKSATILLLLRSDQSAIRRLQIVSRPVLYYRFLAVEGRFSTARRRRRDKIGWRNARPTNVGCRTRLPIPHDFAPGTVLALCLSPVVPDPRQTCPTRTPAGATRPLRQPRSWRPAISSLAPRGVEFQSREAAREPS